MLHTILQKIGLSDKDALVYLACLELGTQPASVVAKKAGLKRPTTYLILEGLLKKGLVSEYNGSNVKYFTPVAPEQLLTFVERQCRELTAHQRELEEYLPQMKSLQNPYSMAPKVRFYEGIEGICRVMDETLNTKNPLSAYSSIDRWFSRDDLKDYIFRYARRRSEKKIPLRGIVLDTPIARRYLANEAYPGDKTLTETRWFPKDIAIFMNEINIVDNKIAICSLGPHDVLGILIESEEIATTQRSIFQLAWKAAQKT